MIATMATFSSDYIRYIQVLSCPGPVVSGRVLPLHNTMDDSQHNTQHNRQPHFHSPYATEDGRMDACAWPGDSRVRTYACTYRGVLVSVLPSVAVLHTTVGGSTVWMYDVLYCTTSHPPTDWIMIADPFQRPIHTVQEPETRSNPARM